MFRIEEFKCQRKALGKIEKAFRKEESLAKAADLYQCDAGLCVVIEQGVDKRRRPACTWAAARDAC